MACDQGASPASAESKAPQAPAARAAGPDAYAFPYDIDHPAKETHLPSILEEVSGLGYVDDQTLLMVQDEKGILFQFDTKSEKITAEYPFGPAGDYEGVEVVADKAMVLESGGSLYVVDGFRSPQRVVRRFKSPMNQRNDPEGLVLLKDGKTLLIACKGRPGVLGKSYPAQRALYAFDLETEAFGQTPFALIDLQVVKAQLIAQAQSGKAREKADEFDPMDWDEFQPSAVAQHPLDDHLYVLASAGKLLVVLNPSKQVVYASFLDKDVLKQPEGICFLSNGDMVVSNEARKGKSNILHFPYQAP